MTMRTWSATAMLCCTGQAQTEQPGACLRHARCPPSCLLQLGSHHADKKGGEVTTLGVPGLLSLSPLRVHPPCHHADEAWGTQTPCAPYALQSPLTRRKPEDR